MTKHYFQNFLRSLISNPGYYLVNISGLAIGLAACLLISHYVWFHRSFDTYQTESKRTYRLNYSRTTESGEFIKFASATPTIGGILTERIPEIEKLGIAYRVETFFTFEDQTFHENKVFYANSSIFEVLGIEITCGNSATPLDAPGDIAVSRSVALKYFGDKDPIGKTLLVNHQVPFIITTVFEDLPINSHLKADIFLPLEFMKTQSPHIFVNGHISLHTAPERTDMIL